MKTFSVPIFCLVLPNANNVKFCSDRAINRSDEFHSSSSNWLAIIRSMSNDYRSPKLYEGFTHIFNCNSDDDTHNALQILKQL